VCVCVMCVKELWNCDSSKNGKQRGSERGYCRMWKGEGGTVSSTRPVPCAASASCDICYVNTPGTYPPCVWVGRTVEGRVYHPFFGCYSLIAYAQQQPLAHTDVNPVWLWAGCTAAAMSHVSGPKYSYPMSLDPTERVPKTDIQ
jgi:hypothetical protein